jgi:acyl dehydratase
MGGIAATPAGLAASVGREMVTAWETIGQERIDGFAEATGDRQWLHVDAVRAKVESPFGTTIAHGYLLVSLLAPATLGVFDAVGVSGVLNYGINRVRFLAPVPAGARLRCRTRVEAVEAKPSGTLVTTSHTLELEGSERPALAAEALWLALG